MDITNEHKHEQLTPQLAKKYKVVEITATVPAGRTLEIDLKRIPLGGGPDQPVRANTFAWSGFEFTTTGVVVMWFLETTLPNVADVVRELSKL